MQTRTCVSGALAKLFLSTLFCVLFLWGNAAFAALVPTIHSTTTGGDWSDPNTWEEGRVPESDDVVEINGDVTLGLTGVIELQQDLINRGTIRGDHIRFHGEVLNNGSIISNKIVIYNNFYTKNGTVRSAMGEVIESYTSWEIIPGSHIVYNLSFSGSVNPDIYLDFSSYYIQDILLEGNVEEREISWKIRRYYTISEGGGFSDWSDPICINASWCTGGSNNNGTNTGSNSSSNPSENSQSIIEYIPTSEYTLAHYNAGIAAITPTNSQDAGDPVLLHSGEFTYANSVMQYSSVGMPFDFSLSYRNQTYYNGPVGNNFDHSYNQYLVEQDGNLYYYDGKLGVYEFTGSGGVFAENTLLRAEITPSGSGYTIDFESGKTLSFNADLKLESIEDIFGNQVSLSYDAVNKNLEQITDTQGRNYTLTYNSDLRLETLTDFTGNSVELSYYGSGQTLGSQYDLQNITLNNAGQEKTISFTYTSGADDTTKHNLVKLIDAAGNTYVENTYDASDRVLTQIYGNGTLSYAYEEDAETGKITQNTVTDREGNTTVYSYDANGNTLSRTSGGNTYSYEYNSENRIIKEIYPRGNGYSYSYDAQGNLLEKRQKADMTAADSNSDLVTSYEYASSFPIPINITLPNGLSTSYQINSLGQITQSVSSQIDLGDQSQSISQSYSYDAVGNLISMMDGLGILTEYSYSGSLLMSETKAGILQNTYSYDAAGRIIAQNDGLGNETQYEYDSFGNLSASTSPEGLRQEFEYSENNKATQSEKIIDQATSVLMQTDYDKLDYPTEIREEIAEGNTAITQLEYNGNEQISKTILPSGAQIEYSYDALGNILTQTLSADGEDLITSYSYDANGNRISQNIDGVITTYSYDLYDRLTSMTDTLGTTTSYSYDTLGKITQEIVKNSQNQMLKHTTQTYNQRGDLLTQTLHDGAQTRTQTLSYDALGNILTKTDTQGNQTSYSYDDLGRLESQTDPYGKTTSYSYDAAGRLIESSLSAEGKTIETNYSYDDDGRLLSETDQLGNTTSYVYNALGQMIQKTDAIGNTTSYSYDYSGNMLSETKEGDTKRYYYNLSGDLTGYRDTKGSLTSYTLNQRGQKTSEMDAQGNFTDYSYNILGELTQIQDANGNTITQSYDALGRLIQRDIQTGANIGGVTQESYQYDGLGRLVGANDSENQALSFSYNGFGDLISETNAGKTIAYSYDNTGNLISQSLDGQTTTLSYDAKKRIESIAYNSQTIISYSYDSFGETGFTLGNGIETNKTFDALQRPQSLISSAISPTGTQTSFNYSYDANSMIIGNSRDFYSYDAKNQLTQHLMSDDTLGVGAGQAYSYDAMGNRTRVSNIKILSGSGANTQTKLGGYRNYDSNELNQYTDFYTPNTPHENGLLYDANGNLTQNNVTTNSEFTYEYDYKNRPIKVTRINPSNGTTVVSEYRYDVLGRRTEKRVNTKTTSYIYAGENVIYEKLTNTNPENGNVLLKSEKYFVYGNRGVDDVLYMKVVTPSETKEYYYEKDERGSILRLTNPEGEVVEEYRYDAFGITYLYRTDLRKYQALGMAGAPSGNTRLFTGREYDNDAMLYYMRARYYEPKLGRFISKDPIGILDNMNLYTYVGNNPVIFVDLFGKAKKFIAAYDDFLQAESAYWNNINLITEMEYYFIMQEKEEIAKQLHYARNQFNTDLPGSIEEAEELKWRIVRSDYHQYNTEEGKENIKYVSPDGYKEIIFRYDGKIDDSVENRGTYNFFDPDGLSGINHILYDVKPWERWGTAPGDQNYLNY